MKRTFDLCVAMLAVAVLLPVLLLVTLLVRVKLGSPVLFSQVRPGLYGKPFRIFKFRTMRDSVDSDGLPLPDELRLTKFGSFLRATSLDELPGLFNVIAGQMSLVGPRPLLMSYLPLYNATQSRRHEVRPGITGWAQVNGRNAITWEEKFAFDVYYVDHASFAFDLRILALTVRKVLARNDINAQGAATMPAFTGTRCD